MLQSVGIEYLPDADRLRIDIRAGDGRISRFMITRRVCKAWLRDLEAMAVRSAELPDRIDPALRASLAGAHHEALAQQAKFGRSEPDASAPLPEPVLLSKVLCGRDQGKDQWALRFVSTGRDVVTLSLSPQTFHGIVELLRKQLARADWELELLPSAAVSGRPESKPSGALH